MHIARLLLLTIISTASSYALAETEAFKCTEADGKISYLDTRPATGCTTIEVVRINVGKGSAPTQKEGGITSKDSEADPTYSKEVAEREKKAKEMCKSQQSNLEALKNNARIRIKDEKGEERILSVEEHTEKLKELEKYIADFCK